MSVCSVITTNEAHGLGSRINMDPIIARPLEARWALVWVGVVCLKLGSARQRLRSMLERMPTGSRKRYNINSLM